MTVLFALFVVFVLTVIFGIAYNIRGWQAALIVTGAMLIGFIVLYAGMIYLIVNSMD